MNKESQERKHHFRRSKKFQYLLISCCIKCGLEREKLPDGSYKLNPFDVESQNIHIERCAK